MVRRWRRRRPRGGEIEDRIEGDTGRKRRRRIFAVQERHELNCRSYRTVGRDVPMIVLGDDH